MRACRKIDWMAWRAFGVLMPFADTITWPQHAQNDDRKPNNHTMAGIPRKSRTQARCGGGHGPPQIEWPSLDLEIIAQIGGPSCPPSSATTSPPAETKACRTHVCHSRPCLCMRALIKQVKLTIIEPVTRPYKSIYHTNCDKTQV